MSASQLLRILKTLPAGADDEISAFNTDELEAGMNRTSRCTNPFLSNENDNQVNFWNNRPELEISTFGNEFTNNHEDETFRKSPETRNVHPHSLAKTTGFRIDKHSVECELPELIVCYKDKESDFHVKDVRIDERIPDEETTSIHADNNQEFLYNSVPVNGDDDDMIEASLDTEFLKHEWLRSSTMACCYMDVELSSSVQNATCSYGPDNPTNTCEEKFNLSTNLQDDINLHPLQGSKDELGKRAIVGSVDEKLDKDCKLKNIFDERKIEESVPFYFDTNKREDSNPCRVVNPESIYELPLETESVVNQQDVASGYKMTVKDHETRYVEGESSFSMAGVISELISCSRPMPFAGGVSTRSDSSAASTRSFAFPTLETEYTSSPTRMGKSQRKRLQKHTGWRKGLLCCKF